MAIYSAVPPPPEQPPANTASSSSAAVAHHHAHTPSAASTIDIEAWTLSTLSALSVSPVARGTGGTPLSIPLDDAARRRARIARGGAVTDGEGDDEEATPRRPPSRRDSQRRREALLKGKEGSRARRRWENGLFSSLFFFPSFSLICGLLVDGRGEKDRSERGECTRVVGVWR